MDEPRADHGNGEEHGVADAESGAGEKVGADGIAEEAIGKGEHEKSEADKPVKFPWTAVGGGEKDAGEMSEDGADEDVGGPVMHLAHEEARADFEAEMKDGLVGGGHGDAIEGAIGAVVDDFVGAAVEEQGKKRSCDDEDDKRVERDFAEHERPVIWKNMIQGAAHGLREAQAGIEPASGCGCGTHAIPQKPGPGGSLNPPPARRVPSLSA